MFRCFVSRLHHGCHNDRSIVSRLLVANRSDHDVCETLHSLFPCPSAFTYNKPNSFHLPSVTKTNELLNKEHEETTTLEAQQKTTQDTQATSTTRQSSSPLTRSPRSSISTSISTSHFTPLAHSTYIGTPLSLPFARGCQAFHAGNVYAGEYENGVFHGAGCLQYKTDDILTHIYTGQFRDGKREGYGTSYNVATKEKYIGHWVADQRQGNGQQWNDSTLIYDGEWLADERSNGTLYFTESSTTGLYTGEWANNTFNGNGTYITERGEQYTGNWQEGKRNGIFTVISSTAAASRLEKYENDELISWKTMSTEALKRTQQEATKLKLQYIEKTAEIQHMLNILEGTSTVAAC